MPYLIGYAVFVLFVAFVISRVRPHWRGLGLVFATTVVSTLVVSVAVVAFLSGADPQSLVTAMMTRLLFAAIPIAFVIGFVVSGLVAIIWRTSDPPERQTPPNSATGE